MTESTLSKTMQLAREQIARARRTQRRKTLIFFHPDGSETIQLVEGQSFVLGRALPSDLIIRDSSLSRTHARFYCRDGIVHVEDLNSTNGVRVNGGLVKQTHLSFNDQVDLGAISLSIFSHDPFESRTLQLESHEHFVTLMERENKRARYFGRTGALLLLATDNTTTRNVRELAPIVLQELREIDFAGLYSDHRLECFLPEEDETDALAFAERLTKECAQKGQTLLVSIGVFPHHGTTAQALLENVNRAMQTANSRRKVVIAHNIAEKSLKKEPNLQHRPIVKRGTKLNAVFQTAEKVAQSKLPLLLFGETGSGKEVMARHIHRHSGREKNKLVSINCGAIPQSLLESTLFGHEKGAFTGAHARRMGVFERAHKGTVFLDEIGELPMDAQASFLRVLEDSTVTRVGGSKEISVDIRIVAATNRDLSSMVDSGHFREDLFYRLNALTLFLPPLRDRQDEIPSLAAAFLIEACEQNNIPEKRLSESLLPYLLNYQWPGNIRELKNVIQRAVVISSDESIEVEDLPPKLIQTPEQSSSIERRPLYSASPSRRDTGQVNRTLSDSDASFLGPQKSAPDTAALAPFMDGLTHKESTQKFERHLILYALSKTNGVQTHAAKLLSVPHRTFMYKMKALGIKKKPIKYEAPSETSA